MATNDLIGVSYSDGYVWNFKVTKGTETATVGVKAIAIDKTLYVTEIDTTGAGKLVTDSAVISYVAQEISKLGKLELEVVSVLPDADETTLGKIYLVPKGEGKKGYTEHITVKSGTEEAPTYAWEEIGDTDVDLDGYVKNTDYATTTDGGVIKSSEADGKISVGTDGIASLNGYDDLVKTADLADYYKMSEAEKTAGTGTLLSADDKTKLDEITAQATKVTAVKDDDGNLTSMTIKSGENEETYKFATPEEPMLAFDEIKVGDKSAKAVSGKTALTIEAGDGIVLETITEKETGGPALKISIDTTDVIDVAEEIPTDTFKDTAIPNVKAVKDYVDGHKGSSPIYDPTEGSIDLTV